MQLIVQIGVVVLATLLLIIYFKDSYLEHKVLVPRLVYSQTDLCRPLGHKGYGALCPLYGAHDKMQPFAASKRLVAALEKNGVDYRYFVAKHSGHGLQNDNKVYMEYLDAVVEYLGKYMKD